MKTLRLILLSALVAFAASGIAGARAVKVWSEQELFDKSDTVVIATATESAETSERADHVDYVGQHVVGVETKFAVSAVLKGNRAVKNLTLHHYRAEGMMVPNGPTLVSFDPERKQTFLLFLTLEADGRYASVTGQVDPGMGVRQLAAAGVDLGSAGVVQGVGPTEGAPSSAKDSGGKAKDITLTVVHVDSEETAGEDGKAANAVDGDTNTFWHTQWQDANPEPPHEIVIKLSEPATIKGFYYLPRQDDSDHGEIKEYEFYVSDDGKEFGQPVKKGEFAADKEKKTVTFEPKKCQYIKLREISEINGEAWASAAEIGIVQGD